VTELRYIKCTCGSWHGMPSRPWGNYGRS